MSKYILNCSGSDKSYQGREILSGEYFQIASSLLSEYSSDAVLLSDLANSVVKMSANGTSALIGSASCHIDFLKDIDPSPRDSDGVAYAKTKITNTGWSYQLHAVEFEVSVINSLYSKKPNGTDFGFAVLKCFKDVSGTMVECTDQTDADTNCVMTQIDWEPTHDYEVMGGMFKQASVPSDDVRLWMVGVPDVPEAYGGSKVFVSNVNLKYMGTEEGVRVDGRAPKYMTYSAVNHTNKFRLILKHTAGFKHKAMVVFEIFKL